MLAGRIAALCATPENRARLTERMVKAQKLERAVIAGMAAERAARRGGDRTGRRRSPAGALRDVICGYLTEDSARLADELPAAPTDPRVSRPLTRRTRWNPSRDSTSWSRR